VPNNSFEEYKKCPEKESQFNKNVLKWWSPTRATPDYYNNCNHNLLANADINYCGKQIPYLGNAYAGIIVFEFKSENYREYIQCKLKESLKKNQLYCCSYRISWADNSEIYTDQLGMYISVEKVGRKDKLAIDAIPQIENKEGEYLNNKTDWILICDTFKATGGEQYITIGNFSTDKKTFFKNNTDKSNHKQINENNDYYIGNDAYYYIDDVSVTALINKSDCPCKDKKTDSVLVNHKPKATTDTIAPTIGESVILRNLVFETNKTEILPSSYEELNKVADYLIKHNKNKIELSGYTDNTGKEEDNQKLSEARAKAVADYLINKGILKERISYKGYGSTKPIATNNTEEGKQENRRVEFMIE
jgi:outer membrane protein OmpA-like peptidoglycan-associated protein